MKRDLSLAGTAEEILRRSSDIIFSMIKDIAMKEPSPVEQTGEVTVFKRRRPEDGNLAPLKTTAEAYDYIRMLQAEGYPRAFVETDELRFEFEDAEVADDGVIAKVKIRNKFTKL